MNERLRSAYCRASYITLSTGHLVLTVVLLGDPYYYTTSPMNGSLRLRAMIARRVRERAENRAGGIAAFVIHTVQAVISAAIALSTSTDHTRSRRQLCGWEEQRVLALTPLHFDQHMSRFSDAKFTRLYRLSKQDFSSLVAKL
jgi:hypothetical protein